MIFYLGFRQRLHCNEMVHIHWLVCANHSSCNLCFRSRVLFVVQYTVRCFNIYSLFGRSSVQFNGFNGFSFRLNCSCWMDESSSMWILKVPVLISLLASIGKFISVYAKVKIAQHWSFYEIYCLVPVHNNNITVDRKLLFKAFRLGWQHFWKLWVNS